MDKADILECDTIRYSSHEFPLHLHPGHYTYSLVVEGSALLVLPRQTVLILPGDLVFIPPHVPHCTVIEKDFTYQVVRSSVYFSNLSLYFDQLSCKTNSRNAVALFQQIFRQLQRGQCPGIHSNNPSFSFVNSENLQQAVAFINEHYGEPIQLSDLSQAAMLSSSHFQRLFKRQFSISPMRYLLSLRIDKAKAFIQQGMSMTEVAFSTGFYDQSHFNKYFKLLVGMAPGNYSRIITE